MADDNVLFNEVQRFRQPVLIAIIIASVLLTIGLFAYAMAIQPSLVLLIIGLIAILPFPVVVWLFLASRLETVVNRDGLFLRFYPFHLRQRKIPLEEVVSFRAVIYRPIWDYGGWGMRFVRGGRAYNVSGREGVRLEFYDGKHLLIGSQRSEELAAAI